MSRELICNWLKIPPDRWPPDDYVLLGLKPGEADLAQIEKHAQERMELLRRYQLAHPDEVTEAMNSLARAFDVLRERQGKKTAPPPVLEKPGIAPPPVRKPARQTVEIAPWVAAADQPIIYEVAGAAEPPPPVAQVSPPKDPVDEAARSPVARRGLATKRALYQRISTTRTLIRSWSQAGKYLANPAFKLRHRQDALDLARQLTILRHELHNFPALLGEAGHAGYYVITLARQPRIVQTYQALVPSDRERLVGDWEAGLMLLAAHRLFLREELRALRRRSRLGRGLRLLWGVVSEYPVLWLAILSLIALNLAYPPLRADWVRQLLIGGGLVGVFVFYQLYLTATRRASLHRSRRRERQKPEPGRDE